MMKVGIVGASADVGVDIAERLGADSSRILYCHYRSSDERLLHLRERGYRIETFKADLEAVDETEALARWMNLSEVDQLIFLPAIAPKIERFHKETRSSFDRQFSVQVLSLQGLLAALLPRWAKNGYGSVVAVLTHYVVAESPPPCLASYVTAKYALLGMMKCLASEYGRKGLRFNMVSPSMMETRFLAHVPGFVVGLEIERHPRKRLVEVGEVAEVIERLLEDGVDAPNGVNVPVTGE